MAILGETGFKVLPFIRANNRWKFHIVYEHKIKNVITINYRIFIYSSLCWTVKRWSCPRDGRFDSHYSRILLHYQSFYAILIIDKTAANCRWGHFFTLSIFYAILIICKTAANCRMGPYIIKYWKQCLYSFQTVPIKFQTCTSDDVMYQISAAFHGKKTKIPAKDPRLISPVTAQVSRCYGKSAVIGWIFSLDSEISISSLIYSVSVKFSY